MEQKRPFLHDDNNLGTRVLFVPKSMVDNGYPLHIPSHARVPAEPQSGPTNSFGRCKCWVLILADRGWPGVRGVKGIPIWLISGNPKGCRLPTGLGGSEATERQLPLGTLDDALASNEPMGMTRNGRACRSRSRTFRAAYSAAEA